ncbi:unnamed protein product [Paramecium sonneborni]|uniref:Uncharacterized protein n=1 Tax=Paramecium sonneborni TaxID=65129 RepID=A0A8S1LUQ4_9CILI|nr:unnamed protein product [Paramecium sonneborni]
MGLIRERELLSVGSKIKFLMILDLEIKQRNLIKNTEE